MLERFTWYRQSAYLWKGDGLNVYIDPWGVTGDPPADVVFITHAHFDHYNPEDLEKVRRGGTKIVAPQDIALELSGDVTSVSPGDTFEVEGIKGQAIHAYNVVEDRLENHPRANNWVGYILDLGGTSYFHAGDTDHTPELAQVRVDVAFLPIGGTYTMTAAEAAEAAKAISPHVAVPMHYGFVVGTPADAETFRRESSPVTVEVLQPQNPFEKT